MGLISFLKNLPMFVKKEGTWGKFFVTGQDMHSVFGDEVVQPYRQIASVYKAVKAIADNIPQAKMIFVNRDGAEVHDQRLEERFARPNAQQSMSDFLQEWAGFYALYGESFTLVQEETVGEAVGTRLPALRNLDPKQMTLVASGDGTVKAWNYMGRFSFLPEQIIHVRDFNPYHRVRGLSPLDPIKDEIEIDQFTLTFNKQFFKNDATPHFVLSCDKSLTPDQRKQIEMWWQNNYGGASKAFKMAVFENGTKPSTIMNTHKEMDFVKQKDMMRDEIIGIWRSPKALFNITEDLNYATFIGQMKIFWQYTLSPILRKFEDGFNAHYMSRYSGSGLRIAFDLKNVPAFQEDLKAKVEVAQMLSQIGFTGNEINEKLELGFEQQPWRDEWWAPAGMAPASMAADPQNDAPPPEKIDDEEDVPKKAAKLLEKSLFKHQDVLKRFLARQSTLEDEMFKALKKYFWSLRRKLLAYDDVELAGKIIDIDWQKFDEDIEKAMRPVVSDAVEFGVAHAQGILGTKKGIEDDVFAARQRSYITQRVARIKDINRTLERQLRSKIDDAIVDGQSTSQMAGVVRDVIREVTNNAGVRAKLIARTESAGAINGGSVMYYQEEGIEKKEWVTTSDEFVRESHRRCQDQGAIDMDKMFNNGLMFPGDQSSGDAGEVCNCRCTLVPVTS